MNETASAPSWKVEKDADAIVWLTLDKPDTSANVLSSYVLRELDTILAPLTQNPPRGRDRDLRQEERLHRRRRHQGIHRHHRRRRRLRADPRAARRFWIASKRCPARPSRPSMALRWAAGSSWRWPAATAWPSTTRSFRWACPKCSSAFIRALAARCAPCGSSACGRRWT